MVMLVTHTQAQTHSQNRYACALTYIPHAFKCMHTHMYSHMYMHTHHKCAQIDQHIQIYILIHVLPYT